MQFFAPPSFSNKSLVLLLILRICWQDTALHLAVRENKPEVVSQLMSLGCELLENEKGAMPIDVAIQFKLHEAAIAMVTHERG